tara:strand:- start:622 stop:1044 length:423 start_codon:yes stop_codon:yes gene_type:complete
MISACKHLGLEGNFSNRVELWKRRAHNPLRKSSRRGKLSNNDVQALITLISATSTRLYPLLRQLLSNRDPIEIKNKRWELISQRFNDLINERMNLNRLVIQNLISNNGNLSFLRELVLILALSSGPQGCRRLESYVYQID